MPIFSLFLAKVYYFQTKQMSTIIADKSNASAGDRCYDLFVQLLKNNDDAEKTKNDIEV
jgi:hypothetical protein